MSTSRSYCDTFPTIIIIRYKTFLQSRSILYYIEDFPVCPPFITPTKAFHSTLYPPMFLYSPCHAIHTPPMLNITKIYKIMIHSPKDVSLPIHTIRVHLLFQNSVRCMLCSLSFLAISEDVVRERHREMPGRGHQGM